MRNPFLKLIETEPVILLDGAMGTLLFAVGLEQGAAPELWNVDFPERVIDVHRRYIAAGSQIILTNSFGGTHYRLRLHGAADRVEELNRARGGRDGAASRGRGGFDGSDGRTP